MKKLIMLAAVFLLGACSTSYNSVKQLDDKAYILVTGNFDGSYLNIDKNTTINLDDSSVDSFKENGKEVVKFQVGAGTHTIVIKKDNSIIVNRKIYVTDGNTFEILVP